MLPLMRRLLADLRAATAIEYTLIVALISMVAVGAMTALGHNVMNMLGPAANAMT
ncbi:MAG: Flp family type IVb pilin [Reyranellales bacterium]